LSNTNRAGNYVNGQRNKKNGHSEDEANGNGQQHKNHLPKTGQYGAKPSKKFMPTVLTLAHGSKSIKHGLQSGHQQFPTPQLH